MTPLGDANAAIDRRRGDIALRVKNDADVTALRPFPDIAGDIEKAVLIGAETPDRSLIGFIKTSVACDKQLQIVNVMV